MANNNNDLWSKYQSRIAGGWQLMSYDLYDATENNILARPHGDQPLGRVLISSNGWLAAHIANPTRFGPLPSGKPWQTGDDAEVAHVARGISMYCGYLQLFEDEDGLYWETTVEISSDPNRKGGNEVRRVQLEERNGKGSMTLRPVKDMVMEVRSSCPSTQTLPPCFVVRH